MNIRPSAVIRQNYNEIAEMCRKTKEPVFLTKNGEGDLVVMDIETYNRRERMLGMHISFLAQVNKESAFTKKKELIAAMLKRIQSILTISLNVEKITGGFFANIFFKRLYFRS